MWTNAPLTPSGTGNGDVRLLACGIATHAGLATTRVVADRWLAGATAGNYFDCFRSATIAFPIASPTFMYVAALPS
jgi:hypothetical protein